MVLAEILSIKWQNNSFLISHLAEVTQRTNRTHSFTDYSTLPVALPSVIAQRSQAVRKK